MELITKIGVQKNNNSPLVVFFFLSFILTWLLIGIVILQGYGFISPSLPMMPLLLLGSWIPNISAFIVVGMVMRKKGAIKRLFYGWRKWRVGFVWYLVAASPIFAFLFLLALYMFFNGSLPISKDFMNLEVFVSLLIMTIITGATGEELGWRGFALPWLQTRMNAFFSSVLLGILWSIWHLPLWFANIGYQDTSFWLFTLIGISLLSISNLGL